MNDEVEMISFIFDGPPGPEGPRFIETEDIDGNGVKVGEWEQQDDGTWALLIPVHKSAVTR